MVKYSLDHLVQTDNQDVSGPIQDDEALFLYAYIRCALIKTIIEIGEGYSTINFIKSLETMSDGMLYSIDIREIKSKSDKHKVIIKCVKNVVSRDIDDKKIDLLFFDCHKENEQMEFFTNMRDNGNINDDTIIVLHDTNLHLSVVHQKVERSMVNAFKNMGYDCICIHTKLENHINHVVPYRHGLTLCKMYKQLNRLL